MKLHDRKATTAKSERDELDNPALYRREDAKRSKTKQREKLRAS